MKIEIRVIPNSKEFSINKDEQGYIIRIKAKPDKNKANAELIKIFKQEFGKKIKIIRGSKSRKKVIEIEGEEEKVLQAIKKRIK